MLPLKPRTRCSGLNSESAGGVGLHLCTKTARAATQWLSAQKRACLQGVNLEQTLVWIRHACAGYVRVPCEGATKDVRRHLEQTKWNHERFWRERAPYDDASDVLKPSQPLCARHNQCQSVTFTNSSTFPSASSVDRSFKNLHVLHFCFH